MSLRSTTSKPLLFWHTLFTALCFLLCVLWTPLSAQIVVPDRLPNGNIPGLPAGFGATSRERMTWIDGHYAHLRAIFSGDPAFLEYDPADPSAPARISAHIGRDLPWWGKANANPTHAHTDDDTQEDAA